MSKINWKRLSKTPGYVSLKNAYIDDLIEASKREHPLRSKAERHKHFKWVINRAKHYAHHTGKSMSYILGEWEDKRGYWWVIYYQPCNQPRLHKKFRVK